jgi:hypothetical protein
LLPPMCAARAAVFIYNGTKLEIWQANSYGRYVHLADRNPAPWTRTLRGLRRLASMLASSPRRPDAVFVLDANTKLTLLQAVR